MVGDVGKVISPWALASASYGFEVRGRIRFQGRPITDDEWRVGLLLANRNGTIRAARISDEMYAQRIRSGESEPAERAGLARLLGDNDPDLERSIAMDDIMRDLSDRAARLNNGQTKEHPR